MPPPSVLPAAPASLASAIADFLADLAHANRSPRTIRAYAADLAGLAAAAPAVLEEVTAEVLRDHFAVGAQRRPATRARQQAALAGFFRWAVRQECLVADPMARLERVRVPEPAPRGMSRAQAEAILAAIPASKRRDRLLFRLLLETGLRIGEALALQVEDLDCIRQLEVGSPALLLRGGAGVTRDGAPAAAAGQGWRGRTSLSWFPSACSPGPPLGLG